MKKSLSGNAIVFRAAGSRFWVRDILDGEQFRCRIPGKMRLGGSRSTSPVVVGDMVGYRTGEADEAVITYVEPRRNYIIRRSSNLSKESHIIAANIDRAVVVATLFSPKTSYEFIDRFLVTCEAYHIPAAVALGKCDLLQTAEERQEAAIFRRNYQSAGYPVIEFSALTGQGMEPLIDMLRGNTTLISGNSGVGKSTLISALCPREDIRTGEVSRAHGKGKHTTTHSTMYPTEGRGWIIDTPGIKGFGLIDIAEAELYRYFPEMLRASAGCQFYNCTHRHEPGCEVIAGVERGEISCDRYESYLKILEQDEKYRK